MKSYKRISYFIIIAGTFLFGSCSQKLYIEQKKPENSYNNSIKQSDSKSLKNFLSEGNGKFLNTRNTTADEIIKTARKYLGVPHCMGGSSKKCTDCSGLVMAVFAEHGISLPHSSEEQARYGQIIRDKTQLQKGDLVFFINSYKTTKYITHAGICIGNNEFIHTSSKKGVTITSLDNSWWKDKYIFGTRVINK